MQDNVPSVREFETSETSDVSNRMFVKQTNISLVHALVSVVELAIVASTI
jgi:hypothetical protein